MFPISLFRRGEDATGLLKPSEFRHEVDLERSRVDRNGSHFAVVVFSGPARRCAKRRQRIAAAFKKQLRATDLAGLLANDQIAVLLPDTGLAGARKVAGDLANALVREALPQPPTMFIYPDDSLPQRDHEIGAGANEQASADHLFLQPLPFWKRCLDVVGSLLAIVVTSPAMLAAAIAVRATSPGPILFKQERVGLGGRTFTIYKFRTMFTDAEDRKAELRPHSQQDGPAFKLKDDPRVTPVGKYLRRTCIDEFPQFWNVLRGEMSLVGPRPLPCDEAAECEPWQRRRLMVTPGLTCIWQVSGGMRIPFVEWMRMDIRYIRSRQFAHDILLLWRTVIAVLLHRASH